ncbi:VOC family protein [Camelliibacillus cellulosilyticus]|uniref:VOC family protein n=1 Tax=Camelliibacillus cellulosilyticus TaxID=2174486 RepID=A0ABV9GP92_9BACL
MKLLKLRLTAEKIPEMKVFYRDILEMDIVQERETAFVVQAGESLLAFYKSDEWGADHFAFRVDADWFEVVKDRVVEKGMELRDEHGEYLLQSSFYQTKQLYFHDPDGNNVEILAQDASKNSKWHGICEIGIPVKNINQAKEHLASITNEYEGSDTFHFYGDAHGVFVLVKENRPWYPTEKAATIHPITVEVESDQPLNDEWADLPYSIIGKTYWSDDLPAVQMRVARPTQKMDKMIQFYRDGVGLKVITAFGHGEQRGIVFGLPDERHQLEELLEQEPGGPVPAPTDEDLLVLYIPNKRKRDEIADRLMKRGYAPVRPRNPYWEKSGLTFVDPDGWCLVLMNTTGL